MRNPQSMSQKGKRREAKKRKVNNEDSASVRAGGAGGPTKSNVINKKVASRHSILFVTLLLGSCFFSGHAALRSSKGGNETPLDMEDGQARSVAMMRDGVDNVGDGDDAGHDRMDENVEKEALAFPFSGQKKEDAAFDEVGTEISRSLRFNPEAYFDPKSTVSKDTITIYLTRGRKLEKAFQMDLSIFKTDILQRYGTGVRYVIREQAECDPGCRKNLPLVPTVGPCLAVARYTPRMYCDTDSLRCNYPQCKTMIAADEFCERIDDFDAREYFTSDRPNLGYLPLGPRLDSWMSLQNIQQNHDFFILPSSRRKFSFNTIFSQSTNSVRQNLAKDIESKGATSKLPIFTSMAKEWAQEVNDENNEQLSTDEYVQVALDSIFTLSPAGHSPECFRIFEAVEMGSIPIISRDDLYGSHHPNMTNRKSLMDKPHPCRDNLHHWYEAPIVVLDSWRDLYPTVERLLEDPAGLDRMQVELRTWYDDYMRKVIREFEQFMLGDSLTQVEFGTDPM
ncbi:hypothetical protein ACHAXR_002706 [Thalassiosira sp. AJA248-18]